jgi:hypothetical protein
MFTNPVSLKTPTRGLKEILLSGLLIALTLFAAEREAGVSQLPFIF